MAKGKHGNSARDFQSDFDGLSWPGQAKSINGQCSRLLASIRAHVRRAPTEGKDANAILRKCMGQVARINEHAAQK